jgi:Trp operon repressor
MNVPLDTVHNYQTDQLLELALAMLDRARREQTGERMPIIDNWLGTNFTLEIIRAKVAANKANATINV